MRKFNVGDKVIADGKFVCTIVAAVEDIYGRVKYECYHPTFKCVSLPWFAESKLQNVNLIYQMIKHSDSIIDNSGWRDDSDREKYNVDCLEFERGYQCALRDLLTYMTNEKDREIFMGLNRN